MPGQSTKRVLEADSSSNDNAPRKVRKGTQSCWECKHRKIKCHFSSPEDDTCASCAQRGSACVSQQLPDPSVGHSSQPMDRLGRIEGLLEQMLTRLDPKNKNKNKNNNTHDNDNDNTNTNNASGEYGGPPPHHTPHNYGHQTAEPQGDPLFELEHLMRPSNGDGVDTSQHPDGHTGDHGSLSVHDVLISHEHIDRILSVSDEVPSSLNGLPCVQRPSAATCHSSAADFVHSLLQLQLQPVKVAKGALILAMILQGLSHTAMHELAQSGLDHRRLEAQVLAGARALMSSNDEMLLSVDGIECLAIESMYHNSAGELRRAWLMLRRAIANAQSLGLDNKAKAGRAGKQSDADRLCVFLIRADCYLSLTLGLPKGMSEGDSFAHPDTLVGCTPTERMQRLHCVATTMIIQRKASGFSDGSLDATIENKLQDAAQSRTPQWWLPPAAYVGTRTSEQALNQRYQLMDQMVHYHLVIRLYLPRLLGSTTEASSDDHRVAITIASRDILVRYIAFRALCDSSTYCRGIDFLMFIAFATLCIAHIDSSRHRLMNNTNTSDYLSHQRLGDRGIMERVLEIVAPTKTAGHDELSASLLRTLRELANLDIDAANGKTFRIRGPLDEDGTFDDSRSNTDNGALTLSIPWVGAVNIEHQRTPQDVFSQDMRNGDINLWVNEWALQGVDTALFDDLTCYSLDGRYTAW